MGNTSSCVFAWHIADLYIQNYWRKAALGEKKLHDFILNKTTLSQTFCANMLLFTQCTSDVDKMNKYVLFKYKNRIQTWCIYMANDISTNWIENCKCYIQNDFDGIETLNTAEIILSDGKHWHINWGIVCIANNCFLSKSLFCLKCPVSRCWLWVYFLWTIICFRRLLFTLHLFVFCFNNTES